MIETSLLKRCALLVWLALLYELGSSTEAKEILFFHGNVTAFVNLVSSYCLLVYPHDSMVESIHSNIVLNEPLLLC